MLKFACKDTGIDCDFVATGETMDEIKEKAFAHAGVAHAEILSSMTEEQKADLVKTLEANTKPA